MAAAWKLCALALAFTISLLGPVRHADATPMAHLVLHSEPGDFIGAGGDFDITYTPENSQLFSSFAFDFGLPAPAEVQFVLGTVTCCSDNTFALLSFGTQALGIPIVPGHYPDAERAAFASPGHPGLDVSFQNRGCNTVAGTFDVTQAVFSAAAQTATGSPIERFSASFEQHCEGFAPALTGSFAYSAFGAAVPEPATWLLVLAALPLLARRALRTS